MYEEELARRDPQTREGTGTASPVIDCQRQEQINDMQAILADLARFEDLSRQPLAWIKTHHNAQDLSRTEIEVYARVLGMEPSAQRSPGGGRD